LPDIALPATGRNDADRPLAVVEPKGAHVRVIAANEAARISGIAPGLKLSAALALTEFLTILERSAEAEQEKLAALAAWADELTPLVSLELPDSLLLEVRGSLKLFGGLDAIKRKLAAELDGRRMSYHLCAAPTPLAALWLARIAKADVLEASVLAGHLGVLPIAVTRWPENIRALLVEMGVHTIGDCLRLPRDGFARRIGAQYLHGLDKALGKQPDLRLGYQAQPGVNGIIELSDESTDMAVFKGALESLVTSIAADLRRRQRQAQNLHAVFQHMRRPATVILLQLIEPTHEVSRLLDPLVARVERVVMAAPVVAISVSADSLVAMRIEEACIFTGGSLSERTPVSAAALVENLRGRFGTERVYGLGLVIEHRPERAWTKRIDRVLQRGSDLSQLLSRTRNRPLWILPVPLPLNGRNPVSKKAADNVLEPERIESGWWDGEDIKRDYYAVTAGRGQKLWVYRDCIMGGWYVHGIFG
jgi:protein ImuB